MKAHLTLAFALLLLCTGAGAALAQTPDHMPPSRETICDNETGAAYGLCNAYCEAMDCESASPSASATACSKVQTKFQNITGRDVTCELPCPCTSIPEFNATLAGANYCVDYSFGPVAGTVLSFEAGFPFSSEYAGAETFESEAVCGYVNIVTETDIILPITPEQFTACVQVAHDAAASRNVTCQSIP